ncbi:HAMP domain-containing histidine kinase [Bacteroides fragilis]|uniref:histidine kinase n=3 Tax=Bacteroides TaxID=816 RepID=A0AAP9SV74_BACFG|nr:MULTISPECIES: HAMP domain-containing sensor histidine kinase [Bacteroides]MBM6510795.1 HAMP domain-containing histidine kinase [Bacteroides fragilis]MCE8573933.1 HAMP domain-containing histidine kinase [Bacteroides fragilis]MCE8624297.1 HAMP domain-containing histidine kinase [Bacteroides fragilis]MCE8700253.1 HAMP domain-containing histidine kinase [Bacteroides fragilis]MCE8707039.1 HAMP domain-containing histidine kinase [Bacteroides fragilis]
MPVSFKYTLFLLLIVISCCRPLTGYAATGEKPILMICSYNPGAYPTSANVSDFMDEYDRLGGKRGVVIENMNCKSFSDFPRWKGVMKDILNKYRGDQEPALIILFGQEAWASYLSLNDSVTGEVPVMCALTSRNVVLLPDDEKDLVHWMPESSDFYEDNLKRQVRGGFMYDYDIASNIRMIRAIYPDTKNIAFISDNTYGGVTLQAHVRREMKKFPDINLILLDGREHTIYTIVDELRKLPKHTVVLIGTWRVDKNEGYFMRNATYSMMEAVPDIPAFTASSIGLGYWAVGGVVPAFRTFGKELAGETVKFLENPGDTTLQVELVGTEALLDSKKVKEQKIDVAALPMKVKLVNELPSFYQQYRYQIWGGVGVLCLLVMGLLVSIYFYLRTKRLKDDLERSQADLYEAKDRAEESNRLKSAFLANMSHEIRTPLNAIVGFSDVLASGGSSEEDQRNYFRIIQSNSDLLLRLINDILDLSRLEADKVTLTPEDCDVVQLCRQALSSVEMSRRESGNRFVFETQTESFVLQVDIQRLQQVLINLLTNAAKFTKNGTITLQFEVEKEKNRVLFAVADTGCGIPKEKQKQVFERFEKLNEYAQGTGLGLSICKLTVDKWGGSIWIDPDYERGARFVVSHPL